MTLNEIQLCFQHIITNHNFELENLKFLTQDNKEIYFQHEIKGASIDDKSQRIHIYANGYYQRLIECIKADLPTMYHFLGEELFNHFAFHYITKFPSKSYTLLDLTTSFSKFLKLTQPNYDTLSQEERIQYELPLELLKLEQVRNKIFTTKGLEQININNTIDENFVGRLNLNPSVHIINLKFELLELFHQLSFQEEEFELPQYSDTIVLAYRHNYRVKYIYLQQWQLDLINKLTTTIINWSFLNTNEKQFTVSLLDKRIIYKT